jgi:hypothetical protein
VIYGAVERTVNKNSFDAKSAIHRAVAVDLSSRNSIFEDTQGVATGP